MIGKLKCLFGFHEWRSHMRIINYPPPSRANMGTTFCFRCKKLHQYRKGKLITIIRKLKCLFFIHEWKLSETPQETPEGNWSDIPVKVWICLECYICKKYRSKK